MGASFFRTNYRGKSLKDAYNDAVEDAEQEYGNDPYNGTISTTNGVIDKTREYKTSGKSLNDFIESQMDKLSKRDCVAICLEEPKANNNKTKSQVEHIVTPGTKKWVLKYVVYTYDNQVGSYPTKAEAVKAARLYTERTFNSTSVVMEKKLEKGNNNVARITYKKSTTEKDGRFVFFGWAAE